MTATLYSYWRSSASYRVRIALALKGATVDQVAVNLMPGVDEQRSDDYRVINPQGRVPFWKDNAVELSQSLAIIDYIDETSEGPELLPAEPAMRARARQLALVIACDIQPVQNLGVLRELKGRFGASQDDVNAWVHDFIADGFAALEALMAQSGCHGAFCVGDTPSIADICLVPQVYNAERFKVDMLAFPIISGIVARCRAHPAFIAAAPENQPDAT